MNDIILTVGFIIKYIFQKRGYNSNYLKSIVQFGTLKIDKKLFF